MSLAFDNPVQRLPGDMYHTWYDERRRQLMAAMLPQPHLGNVLEIACESATLSDLLAPRAQQMCRISIPPPTTGHFECLQASHAMCSGCKLQLRRSGLQGVLTIFWCVTWAITWMRPHCMI